MVTIRGVVATGATVSIVYDDNWSNAHPDGDGGYIVRDDVKTARMDCTLSAAKYTCAKKVTSRACHLSGAAIACDAI